MNREISKTLDDVSKKLGIEFRHRSLLGIALLHRSFASQYQIAKDNERMEYLGDSILNACVSDILFHRLPGKSEGELTKIRSNLVSRMALRKWGKKLKIKDNVFVSEETMRYMQERETHIIENTMEAIIGAIYLDRGFDAIYSFIEKWMENQDFHEIVDHKSRLQEYAVEKYGEIPRYDTISEDGASHRKRFKVAVSVRNKIYGKGSGGSKKEAHQNAAQQAYKKLVKSDK